MAVKLVIFFSFWQYVVIAVAADRGLIKETKFWTVANISDGLNSLLICLEMIIFSIYFAVAFDYRPYRPDDRKHTPRRWKAFVDALNPWDFIKEIWFGLIFCGALCCGRPVPEERHSKRATISDFSRLMDQARQGSIGGFGGDVPEKNAAMPRQFYDSYNLTENMKLPSVNKCEKAYQVDPEWMGGRRVESKGLSTSSLQERGDVRGKYDYYYDAYGPRDGYKSPVRSSSPSSSSTSSDNEDEKTNCKEKTIDAPAIGDFTIRIDPAELPSLVFTSPESTSRNVIAIYNEPYASTTAAASKLRTPMVSHCDSRSSLFFPDEDAQELDLDFVMK